MKKLITALVLVMTIATPAHAEDMQKYLNDTMTMIEEGKHKEALNRLLWFHDHALEHAPAMYGVRLSFALGYWKQLGEVYPPAMVALKKTRDDKTSIVMSGKGTRRLFHDVMALNRTLGEDRKTVDLFRKLDKNQGEFATECWDIAEEAVINEKAYDLAKKYISNPVRKFDDVKESYERKTAMYGDKSFGAHRKEFKNYNENNFVTETLRLIDLAIALDDTRAAKEIQEKALAILDDDRLRNAIPKN